MFAAFLLACVGGEKGHDSAEPVTFERIEAEIAWSVMCIFSCHGIGVGGLLLDGVTDYARLVGVPSTQLPDRLLVEPGQPESSYLYQKIRGDEDIEGGRMPNDLGLSDDKMALIMIGSLRELKSYPNFMIN